MMNRSEMPTELCNAILGSLLHDIGKPVQRARLGYRGKHSAVGRAFLKKVWLQDSRNPSDIQDEDDDGTQLNDQEILDSVSYHHAAALHAAVQNGRLAPDAPAFIAYIADNIAAGADRRKADDDGESGSPNLWSWDAETPLYSVFNRFASPGNTAMFRPELLDDREPINMPTETKVAFDAHRYTEITNKLAETLAHLDRTPEYITSLLNVLEATLSYVPSSTNMAEVVDVSLYDHLKLTGAFGACIWHYLEDRGERDYRTALLGAEKDFYHQPAFMLASFDLSGIQDFIYTIHSSGAAKMLRARSFYLEMLAEHIVDELLDQLRLTRANLNYTGGGHAYLVVPNTTEARETITRVESQVNDWLLDTFGVRLFVAFGMAPFSAASVMRGSDGSDHQAARRSAEYRQLYADMSDQISDKKASRYTAHQIRQLNGSQVSGERECRVCHDLGDDLTDELCQVCHALQRSSRSIQECRFLFVCSQQQSDTDLPLPFGRYLSFGSRTDALRVVEESYHVRTYSKNKYFTGDGLGIHLWVGDYYESREFSDYANGVFGIDRLAVARMDVDNLGQAFTQGFMHQGSGAYNTISRTSSFSRMLSLFFRQHINYICERPRYRPITQGFEGGRRLTVIYSGGDDVFVIGAWADVVEFAVELRSVFAEYTQGKLTLSAGIGMYPDKYPISVMARDTGDLEAAAKAHSNEDGADKDAVTLFMPDMIFSWDALASSVIGEKLAVIRSFFEGNPLLGKAFVYKLLALLDFRDDQISLARWVYFLSRMQSVHGDSEEFRVFANQLYRWFQSVGDTSQLKMALLLYVYSVREIHDTTHVNQEESAHVGD